MFARIVTLAIILVCAAGLLNAEIPETHSRIRVYVPDRDVLDRIWDSGVDFEGMSGRVGDWMEFVAGSFELQELASRGIVYETVIPDLAADAAKDLAKAPVNALGFGYGSMGGFYTYNEMIQQLDSMRSVYPSLISTRQSIATSHGGKAVWIVKISDTPELQEPDEPEVLFTALHHAREPQGMMTLLYYMWWLLEQYGIDDRATYLVNNRQLWFIPVVNPDGYVYNQTTNPGGGGMWRKNRRNNGDGSYGVDLNRNYGTYAMWNSPNGGSSTSPSSDTYRGPSPFSEPELQGIDAFMRAREIKTCLNYHTYGNYLIYPWGYLSTENADSLIYRDWAFDMTRNNHYTNGTDQQTVNYSTRGNSDDYMFGDTTKPITYTMTPEVGTTSFWPGSSQILPLAVENLKQNILISYFAEYYPHMVHVRTIDEHHDGSLNRNESFSLLVDIKNRGLASADNLTVTVSTNSPYVHIPDSSQLVATIGSQAITTLGFEGYVSGSAITGEPFDVYVEYTDTRGFIKTDTTSFVLGTPTILLTDDASTLGRWTTGQGWGLTSDAHSAPTAFTDSPLGPYSASADNSLILQAPVNLGGFNHARLVYWTKWAVEPTWDFATVEISSDGGSTWTTLRSTLSHGGSGRSGSRQPSNAWGYPGYTPGMVWTEQYADLTPYLGQFVQIRFRVSADNGEQRDGFYVDDVEILGYLLDTNTAAIAPPPLLNPPDFAVNQSNAPILTWHEIPGAVRYHIQAASDSEFSTTVLDDSTITDTSYHLTGLHLNTTYYWRARSWKDGFGGWTTPPWRFSTSDTLFTIAVLRGWNLVSAPVIPSDQRKEHLFPTAVSGASWFDAGGYVTSDSILHSRGYWLKFPSPQSIEMGGSCVFAETISVAAGWNLIGGISAEIPLASIEQQPAAIIEGGAWNYRAGYIPETVIKPGSGMFIKVREDGFLILSSPPPGPTFAQPITASGEVHELLISDSSGSFSRLLFSSDSVPHPVDMFEMPPPPPAGVLDARFSDSRMAAYLTSAHDDAVITLRADNYPVHVRWTIHPSDVSSYEIAEEARGTIRRVHPLTGSGTFTIDDASVNHLRLRTNNGERTTPAEFALRQNYPNPFNGTTVIEYDIPEPSVVFLTLYDILGRKIVTAIDGEKKTPGRYRENIRLDDVQSGVYFYRMTIHTERGAIIHRVNTMMLIK